MRRDIRDMPDLKKWATACQKCDLSLEIIYTTTDDEQTVREHLGKLMDLHMELVTNDQRQPSLTREHHTHNPTGTDGDTRKWPHRIKPYRPENVP